MAKVGEAGHGIEVLLSGQVEISQHDEYRRRELIVTHGPGGFVGELGQLSGQPFLIDAYCVGEVEVLVIVPDRLRALLVAEAELGERIMRALILRRVGLIQTGDGGPIVVGRDGDADVLRLEGFLSDPNTDWLAGSGLRLDARGFVLTGPEARAGCLPLETSRPGVFAVGDVRDGSTRRVASAVGDGAQVVASLHAYLAPPPALLAVEPALVLV